MRNTKLTKKVLLASSAIVLLASSGVVLGTTYSIWNAKETVNNHIAAGSLKIELKRTKLVETKYNDDGLIYQDTDNTVIDLATDNSKIFNVSNAFPTWKALSTINIKNVGTVPVDYSAAINFNFEALTEDNDKALAEQLKVSILTNDGTKIDELMLDEVQSEDYHSIGSLTSNSNEDFTVAVEFIDEEENNNAMLGEVTFDLTVKAVQKIATANN